MIEKVDDITCTRIKINNKEYLRIDGYWFIYTDEQYVLVNDTDATNFEKNYLEKYKK